MDGNGGDDLLVGGYGNDTLIGGAGNDVFWGGRIGIETLGGTDTADYSTGSATGSDAITLIYDGTGTTAHITVKDGLGGTDTLHSIEKVIGTAKTDILQIKGHILPGTHLTFDANHGQTGSHDVINGKGIPVGPGLGFHVEIHKVTGETDVTSRGFVKDTSSHGGGQIDLLNFDTNVVGTDANDTVIDDTDGAKYFTGGDGDDSISTDGSTGDARLLGGDGDDELTGGSGNDVLAGETGHNILHGGGGDDLLIGTSEDGDLLDGGEGNDYLRLDHTIGYLAPTTLIGGAGDDVIDAASRIRTDSTIETTVNFASGDGHDTILQGVTFSGDKWGVQAIDMSTLSSSDVTFVWDATFDDGGTNYDPGPSGELLGSYSLFHGNLAIVIKATGDSIYLGMVFGQTYYDGKTIHTGINPSDTVVLNTPLLIFSDNAYPFHGSSVQIASASSYNVAAGEYAGHGVGPDVDLTGTSGDDSLDSDGRNGTIDAGGGDDSIALNGGTVTVDGGSGNDEVTIFSSLGDFQRSLAGGSLVLTGFRATDGSATLANVETIFSITDGVSYNVADLLGQFGTAGDDTIVGTAVNDSLDGGAGNDYIDGGDGDDYIDGGTGNDTLIGGGGADLLIGGAGDDVYVVDNPDDYVVENVGEGNDTLKALVSYVLGEGVDVETSRLIGASDINLTGNADHQILIGNTGNNVIDGGGGGDRMKGAAGDDTYIIRSSADVIVEIAGDGSDTVKAAVSYTLGAAAQIEHLLTIDGSATTAINLTGNDYSHDIQGNAGANVLTGGTGDDVLKGFAGNDTLVGGGGADRFVFDHGTGQDNVGDFVSGSDKLDLSAFGFASFAAVQAATHDVGGNAVIDLGGGDSVTLSGVLSAQLQSGDVILSSSQAPLKLGVVNAQRWIATDAADHEATDVVGPHFFHYAGANSPPVFEYS